MDDAWHAIHETHCMLTRESDETRTGQAFNSDRLTYRGTLSSRYINTHTQQGI
jgi:hypothetical protein